MATGNLCMFAYSLTARLPSKYQLHRQDFDPFVTIIVTVPAKDEPREGHESSTGKAMSKLVYRFLQEWQKHIVSFEFMQDWMRARSVDRRTFPGLLPLKLVLNITHSHDLGPLFRRRIRFRICALVAVCHQNTPRMIVTWQMRVAHTSQDWILTTPTLTISTLPLFKPETKSLNEVRAVY